MRNNRSPVRGGKIELVRQTSDLFEIHDHRRIHMKQGHADALGTFCIAVHFVGSKGQLKAVLVLQFSEIS